MIILSWMTDAARIIGDTDPIKNDARFPMLPPALRDVMEGENGIYNGDYFAGGPYMASMKSPADNPRIFYCLTRNPSLPVLQETHVQQVTNVDELAEQFKDNDTELVVVGGKVALELLLPHASELRIAETTELVPGDIHFDAWEEALKGFSLISDTPWEGGHTLIYRR